MSYKASGVYAAAAVRASCSLHPTVRYTIVCTLVLLLLQISSLLIFFHQIVLLVIIFAFVQPRVHTKPGRELKKCTTEAQDEAHPSTDVALCLTPVVCSEFLIRVQSLKTAYVKYDAVSNCSQVLSNRQVNSITLGLLEWKESQCLKPDTSLIWRNNELETGRPESSYPVIVVFIQNQSRSTCKNGCRSGCSPFHPRFMGLTPSHHHLSRGMPIPVTSSSYVFKEPARRIPFRNNRKHS